ncbi:MAG: type II toxin-antitoxin system VapC family toxin [Desulfomonilaceae bacterium]
MPYLFDSHAILAFFQDEQGSQEVAGILNHSLKQGIERLLCVVNLGEIIYLTKRRFGNQKKIEVLGQVYRLGFRVLSATDEIVFHAAEIKGEYPLSYADCFAVACAMKHRAILVTGDPEFAAVSHLVNIHWIRRHTYISCS